MFKNKKVFILIFMAITLLLISSCSNSGETSEKPTLVVVNWKEYGSDDEKVIKEFEEKCSCNVVHQYMASEPELLTKIRTDGSDKIDVILPNASILPKAVEEGLLEKIDTSKLKNYQYLDKTFTSLPENSKDGDTYAIPWVWGSTAIGYNSDVITEDINSIDILWNETYKGKITFRDDYNDAIMTAALKLGQDPNNPSDLEAIKKELIEQKGLNQTYWKTGDQFSKLFANNQISLGLFWSGQAAAMKNDGHPIKYVIPKEGAIGWVDNWAIVKGTNNKDIALQFIDFMISKEFQYNWAKAGGPAPANTKAIEELDPEYVKEMGLDNETISRLHFISYHTDEQKKKWNELWQEVKAH